MHLTKPISPLRPLPRYVTPFVALALVVVAIMAITFAVNTAQQAKRQQEHAVAAHWQQAGVSDAQSTIKDDHTKRTTGTLGGCSITVEGFAGYTSVTLRVDGPHTIIHEERFTPTPGTATTPAVSSDVAATDFVHALAAKPPTYCTAG